jgi:simple sugar transport system ATP-binding protein
MQPALEFKGIVKVYPNGLTANKGVSFAVMNRTIHAVVGENGAGKTTLMKVLFGMESSQEGEILYQGRPLRVRSPLEAIHQGIGMVHQHFMLAPDLTVVENLVLGIEPKTAGLFLDLAAARREIARVSELYGLSVPIDEKTRNLPVGVRQRVEILKALYRKVDLLILDEPTAVLTPQETDALFATLRSLKENGKTVIFISHKLKEVLAIADTVTVMRDGRVVETVKNENLSEQGLARLMVGRDVSFSRIPSKGTPGATILEARDVTYLDRENITVLNRVSFQVREGEILGLAGVDGNGQSELVEIINGLLEPAAGVILIRGVDVTGDSPRTIRARRLAHIPQDRMRNGVAAPASVSENLIADRYFRREFSGVFGRLRAKHIEEHSSGLVRDFAIKTPDTRTRVVSLSGGNIQKVVVARELSAEPEIVVAAHPTRGIDVGSEEMIHAILAKSRDRGQGVLLVSADLDEILKLADRIIVIYNGEIVGRFDSDVAALTAADIGPYMLGVRRDAH